jgi:SsrA-binding protein
MAAKKKKKDSHLPEGAKVLIRNRRATYDYQIAERIEAGISLVGSEVKSLREGKGSIAEGFAVIRGGEVWLVGCQINEYPWANQFNHEPTRDRRLLLHKHEIKKLAIKTQQRGYTLIPVTIYLNADGKIKVELGLAHGKRKFDKRETAREKTHEREMKRGR